MTFCGLADYRPIPRSTKVRPAYRASNVLLKIARNGKSPVPRSIRSTGLKLIWRCQSEWSCSQCLTFAAIPFPDFQTAGFSSSRPQSRLAIPRVFFSRFRHGWLLLSARRHRKRTVDFSAVPCGIFSFGVNYLSTITSSP